MRRWWSGSAKTAAANGATYGLSVDQVSARPCPATAKASVHEVLRPCSDCRPVRKRIEACSGVASKSPARIGGGAPPAAPPGVAGAGGGAGAPPPPPPRGPPGAGGGG